MPDCNQTLSGLHIPPVCRCGHVVAGYDATAAAEERNKIEEQDRRDRASIGLPPGGAAMRPYIAHIVQGTDASAGYTQGGLL